jgi:hypothetical protein
MYNIYIEWENKMLKAEGYKAQVFQYTERENVIHVEFPDGKIMKVLLPKDISSFDTKLPFGINFVFYGHYV